eukprot:GHVT01008912.1.p2 GENE.GHVT01008912.1~~GHVT01008912.1.p2  ORF type:complete len:177 (-),score=36.44 GHVT01008912.1:4976-5506(-)
MNSSKRRGTKGQGRTSFSLFLISLLPLSSFSRSSCFLFLLSLLSLSSFSLFFLSLFLLSLFVRFYFPPCLAQSFLNGKTESDCSAKGYPALVEKWNSQQTCYTQLVFNHALLNPYIGGHVVPQAPAKDSEDFNLLGLAGPPKNAKLTGGEFERWEMQYLAAINSKEVPDTVKTIYA